ncbi:Two component system sensor histidine kinase MtrB [Amycolatopsis camponoti]|uniref:histidine kinase n=1 Tax=Amycolatopsis camponoti TaxID=2606593 RepID=A0A6I8LKZ5_9PSEU|nr:HAMP domain-containing sensor histidine kinase [Amycolatopsis camponoti]VVJ17710.1 Two component system sensor histidine kinase MtrB [Amycolatopsis camponoti]
MRRPSFGLRTKVTAAVVLVTVTATAVMAFTASKVQEDDAVDSFAYTAKTSFGALFEQSWRGLEAMLAGRTTLTGFSREMSGRTAEWALFTKRPDGSADLTEYASTDLWYRPHPVPVRVGDRERIVAPVADRVLVRTDKTMDLLTAITEDPATGRRLLVVSGNFADYWLVQFFDLTPLDLDLAAQRTKLVYIALGVTVLGIAAAVFAAWNIQRPVRRVASAARELGDGAFDVRVPVQGRDELADLAASFNVMARRVSESIEDLRTKDRQQRRFVADVAHDLRTPLASMVATVDTLDSAVPETRTRAAELLGTQARRLARLVEDLLEISRFDAGSADFRPELVDLPALVEDAIEVSVPDAAVEVTSAGDTTVFADPRRVHTVVGNLLVNATRHGRTPITVSLTGTADAVTIRVADSGPGIPDELLPILFDRFVRGDQARRATEGSGLGLSIARENTLINGGEITVHNDHGAVFTVRLPRESPA